MCARGLSACRGRVLRVTVDVVVPMPNYTQDWGLWACLKL